MFAYTNIELIFIIYGLSIYSIGGIKINSFTSNIHRIQIFVMVVEEFFVTFVKYTEANRTSTNIRYLTPFIPSFLNNIFLRLLQRTP